MRGIGFIAPGGSIIPVHFVSDNMVDAGLTAIPACRGRSIAESPISAGHSSELRPMRLMESLLGLDTSTAAICVRMFGG